MVKLVFLLHILDLEVRVFETSKRARPTTNRNLLECRLTIA